LETLPQYALPTGRQTREITTEIGRSTTKTTDLERLDNNVITVYGRSGRIHGYAMAASSRRTPPGDVVEIEQQEIEGGDGGPKRLSFFSRAWGEAVNNGRAFLSPEPDS